jgi:hypothetical protein
MLKHIAPDFINFDHKSKAFIQVGSWTNNGHQSRLVNPPISTKTTLDKLKAIPFAYGIDSRFWSSSQVHLLKVSFVYSKETAKELTDINAYEKLGPYNDSQLEIYTSNVQFKFKFQETDDPDESGLTYSLSLSLPLDRAILEILSPFWDDIQTEWGKRLKAEFNQLDLFESKHTVLKPNHPNGWKRFSDIPDEVVDEYVFHPEQLLSKAGKLLTGGPLISKKKKLIFDGTVQHVSELNNPA